ncbi:hypothetical protein KEM48_010698 [Puccinia striiformis f. sp. tritici PST-130]|nr:hypothetical protein KEM48_010698 [Puccinia striiformis f. sp. tritici PST-130]
MTGALMVASTRIQQRDRGWLEDGWDKWVNHAALAERPQLEISMLANLQLGDRWGGPGVPKRTR